MIRPGFLDPESRQDLIELTRDGSPHIGCLATPMLWYC
jgi:hypothetical protein